LEIQDTRSCSVGGRSVPDIVLYDVKAYLSETIISDLRLMELLKGEIHAGDGE
jgi:hypothetical protein